MTKTRAMAIGVSNPLEQVAGAQSFEIRLEVSTRSAPGDTWRVGTHPTTAGTSRRLVRSLPPPASTY